MVYRLFILIADFSAEELVNEAGSFTKTILNLMKKSVWAACVVAALCANIAFASAPSQDKPVSKTVTTVKKTTPATSKTVAKTVHKKHVKQS